MLARMPTIDELREAVRRDGRTQRDIAKAAGIHFVSLSRYMTGNRHMPLDAAERLAKALRGSIRFIRRG